MFLAVLALSKQLKTLEDDFDIFELLDQFVEVEIHDTAELENSKLSGIKDENTDK